MKILSIISIMMVSSFIVNAADPTSPQWVSTNVQKRNAIIEEYTGWQCQHCPDGHKVAQKLVADNPGKIFVVNIHTGYLSPPVPSYEGWDLRTSEGDALAGALGSLGFPSGTVNRTGTPLVQSRGSWASSSNKILGQNSPVNIFVKAYLNPVSRKMFVEVELYYTANSDTPVNKLTVMLLQNEIIGGQKDNSGSAPYYPDMHLGIISANNHIYRYRHQHVLRKFISPGGAFGENIITTTQGSYIYKKYELDIPQTIIDANVPVKLENLEVLAFIAEGQSNIYTGVAVVPSTDDLANLTLNSNPQGGGILTGAGDYKKGEKVTITATPASVDYTFENWTDKNNKVLSSNTSYEITINTDTIITANFKYEKRYYVNVTIEPDENAGIITGLKEYYLTDEFCELTATANEGYKFRGWYSGASYSPSPNFTLKINKDENFTARFFAVPKIVSQSPSSVTVDKGEELLLEVVTTGDSCSYQWFKDEVKIDGATQNKYTISSVTLDNSGTYICEISNFAGTITSEPIKVIVTIGIKESQIKDITINPNPTNDNINVSLNLEFAGTLNISLVNILGEHLLELYNEFVDTETFTNNFSIKTLPIGTYFLKIKHNEDIRIEKIIKK